MKKVIMYTTSTCHFCGKAKEWFEKNKVGYVAYNVGENIEKRKEMITKSGQMGVPVIMVGDDVVVGFNESRLAKLLDIK